MPPTALRSAAAVRAAARSITASAIAKPTSTPAAIRALSTSNKLQSADHGHEEPYDPPTGWLFGVKPGEKYQKEGWEGIFMWGFCGSMAVAVVAYAFKPDTSIQTWALEEARRRLEVEGILSEPEDK